MMRPSLIASYVPLCEALRAHCVSIMAALGHRPEVAPFESQVWALFDAEPVVDYLRECTAILALMLVAFAVWMLSQER
jgi:hypothetical protein